jgi:TP901 family phage tail tape measure protein
MSNLGTLWITLSAKTADFRKQLKTSADKISALSNQFKSISIAAGATSAALTGISVVAVRAASNFEKSMIRVKAISQANDEQFAALKGRALELGATTEHSAQAAADGMGFMAMAGIQVNDIIKAMPSVLQLATAGQMDLARAADITTNIMKGMGMEVDQLGKANDVLVSTFTGSNVSLEMLGESFKYVGPVALSAGVGFEEVAAMIGGLGNAGIQGSMAGTTLRMAIARLIKPTAEVSEALDRLRINVQDSSGRLLPMVDIVRQLEEKGAQTADIMSIFGLRAGPGILAGSHHVSRARRLIHFRDS